MLIQASTVEAECLEGPLDAFQRRLERRLGRLGRLPYGLFGCGRQQRILLQLIDGLVELGIDELAQAWPKRKRSPT